MFGESELLGFDLNRIFPNKKQNTKEGNISLNDFISDDKMKTEKIKSKWRGDTEYIINNHDRKSKRMKYDFNKANDDDDDDDDDEYSSDEKFSSDHSSLEIKDSDGFIEKGYKNKDSTRKRALELRELAIGKDVNKKEFEEAIVLTKKFEKLRNGLMSDPNVEFFLFVHGLVNIPIKIFEPLSTTDDSVFNQTQKNLILKDKLNNLEDLKLDLEREKKKQKANMVKKSFEFINQPLITNRLELDPKVISSMIECLTNLQTLLEIRKLIIEDYDIYELIITDKSISKLFARLIWLQLSRDQNTEGQMNKNGDHKLKIQAGNLSYKIVFMLMKKMGYDVHIKQKL